MAPKVRKGTERHCPVCGRDPPKAVKLTGGVDHRAWTRYACSCCGVTCMGNTPEEAEACWTSYCAEAYGATHRRW